MCVCYRMMGEAERSPIASETARDAGVLTQSRYEIVLSNVHFPFHTTVLPLFYPDFVMM